MNKLALIMMPVVLVGCAPRQQPQPQPQAFSINVIAPAAQTAPLAEQVDFEIQYRSAIDEFYLSKRLQELSDRKLYISHLRDELDCLAQNVYREAAFEPERGMEAVAIVTMNRVHSKGYPDSICGVVYQRGINPRDGKITCQFSWTCKPRHRVLRSAYREAMGVAREVYLEHESIEGFSDVTLYYADYIAAPRWTADCQFVAQIGHHMFYKAN